MRRASIATVAIESTVAATVTATVARTHGTSTTGATGTGATASAVKGSDVTVTVITTMTVIAIATVIAIVTVIASMIVTVTLSARETETTGVIDAIVPRATTIAVTVTVIVIVIVIAGIALAKAAAVATVAGVAAPPALARVHARAHVHAHRHVRGRDPGRRTARGRPGNAHGGTRTVAPTATTDHVPTCTVVRRRRRACNGTPQTPVAQVVAAARTCGGLSLLKAPRLPGRRGSRDPQWRRPIRRSARSRRQLLRQPRPSHQ